MMHGRTSRYDFTRDDGSEVVIEYKRTPYDPGVTYGLPEHCYPPEGGDVTDWAVDGGVTLTDAEEARAIDELNALPPDEHDDREWEYD